VLMDNGPVKCCHDQDNYFAVQKGGKASLKGLFMNVDQMSSQGIDCLCYWLAIYD
jgi:hypothetical protein